MKTVTIREIPFGSDDYQAELALREKILRQPLGLKFTSEELRRENEGFHLGAFQDRRLVGCLYLLDAGQGAVRMRQVAIDDSHQRQGVGRSLVEYAEAFAKDRGFTKMILTARQTALPFYRSLGYETCSDVFVEVTIPHQKMQKDLRLLRGADFGRRRQ